MSYLYGYGGKLDTDHSNNNDNIFNLYSPNDTSVKYKNICDVFKTSLDKIIPFKTICLSKLIRFMTKKIYQLFQPKVYNILFIITRELPDDSDKQEIIDSIIESSYLPVTIIIIGEGNNDFYKLKHFFGEKINETKIGIKKTRNNILFKIVGN